MAEIQSEHTEQTSDGFELISDEHPTGERWDPLGGNDIDNEVENITQSFSSLCSSQCFPLERLRALEEEQEVLNASLLQLTTHFAQVQFRLRQVVDAPLSEKEHLLKSLEEFAFRGVTDSTTSTPKKLSHDAQFDRLAQRHKQLELIEQLKSQLTELENFTFKSKDEETATPEFFLEKQRVLIDELKHKINADNRSDGDGASTAITPLKMKEQLINQFKTQIADLERFIQFLQEGTQTSSTQCTCSCPVHGVHNTLNCHHSSSSKPRSMHDDEVKSRTIGIMKKAATLLQMFIVMQFGCGPNEHFRRNDLKTCYNHWGDLRARLELAVARIEELCQNQSNDDHQSSQNEYFSDHDDSKNRLVTAVRKQLAPSICDLLQHGLIEQFERTSVVPVMMCFAARQAEETPRKMHPWQLILQYYELKNGQRYNTTPARKLSQSFNLELADSHSVSHKQNLLFTIGSIIATHSQYKRSYDAHFKAFICAALNSNKLVIWLSLILQCKHLILNHYHTWSYIMKTGFNDSLQSLDRLTQYKFDLPVDLAVRHFQNIKDLQ
ncbi:RUN domain-containing protein 1 [Chrysoperla carnea]|uniref:RUN domain-containing protein 1 n=1 Tax=Chrysoperla carnea TaxID=189513 RepID=UPI001D081D53|nr:RUN domain-containing protein 1 [Chrysoperla carnea]